MKVKAGSTNWPFSNFKGVLAFMRELSHQSEDYMESQLEKQTSIELQILGLDDECSPPNASMNAEDTSAHQQYALELPHLQRSALLIMLMAELEKRMGLCGDFVQHSIGAKVSVGDLSGSGLDRVKRYLTIHAELKNCFRSDSWNILVIFRDIRNIAVHSHKISDQKRAEMEKKRDKFDSTLFCFRRESFSHGDQLFLRPHYLDVLCEQIEIFVTLLEDELGELHPKILGEKYFRFSGEGGEEREIPDIGP